MARSARASAAPTSHPEADDRVAPKPLSRRDEILESAAELFAARSYEGTSMRDIAQANGVKISTLYSHFESKAALFDEIVRPLIFEVTAAQHAAAATDAQPGFARLRAMVEQVVRTCVRNQRAMAILHYSWPQLRVSAEHTALVADNAAVFTRWRDAIDAAIADTTLRADLDPHLVARLLTSAIQGLVDRERYLEHDEPDTAREDVIFALIDEVVLARLRPPRATRAMARSTPSAKAARADSTRRTRSSH